MAMMIEWVVVKGWEEELVKQDTGQPDIWGESRYHVFQRITENANAAMLHFQSPIYPELAVKSFMTYLHSFGSLFSENAAAVEITSRTIYLPPGGSLGPWRPSIKTADPDWVLSMYLLVVVNYFLPSHAILHLPLFSF